MKPNQEQLRFDRYYNMIAPQGRLIYVGRLLQRAANQWPDNIALICQTDRITYKDLYYRALTMSAQLKDRGIKPRDRVIKGFETIFAHREDVVRMDGLLSPEELASRALQKLMILSQYTQLHVE